jgi:hypothetical protein
VNLDHLPQMVSVGLLEPQAAVLVVQVRDPLSLEQQARVVVVQVEVVVLLALVTQAMPDPMEM